MIAIYNVDHQKHAAMTVGARWRCRSIRPCLGKELHIIKSFYRWQAGKANKKTPCRKDVKDLEKAKTDSQITTYARWPIR